MRRSSLAVWAILVTGFLPLFAQQKAPAIVFDGERHMDLGNVMAGDVLKQVFKFTNKGHSRLEILNVQPG
jgi:hypothetical protein